MNEKKKANSQFHCSLIIFKRIFIIINYACVFFVCVIHYIAKSIGPPTSNEQVWLL